jgi:hypothetical protein
MSATVLTDTNGCDGKSIGIYNSSITMMQLNFFFLTFYYQNFHVIDFNFI